MLMSHVPGARAVEAITATLKGLVRCNNEMT